MNDVTSTNRESLLSSIRNEFRMIFSDEGVLLIIVFAMLIYTTIYSLATRRSSLHAACRVLAQLSRIRLALP